MKTIIITGKGTASIAPNQIEVGLIIKTKEMVYSAVNEKHEQTMKKLMNKFYESNFSEKEIKTQSYNVESVYKSVKNFVGEYVSKFDGFEIRQSLTITFDYDLQRLENILNSLNTIVSDFRLDIRFKTSEKEYLQNTLLETACKDAYTKAEILARACNQKIKDIEQINYSFSTINVYSKTSFNPQETGIAKCSANIQSFTPADIEDSINVTFTFNLE